MDAKFNLARDYNNKAIYTSAYYAHPEDNLKNHQKLFETMKAFTLNQHPDTPFSLQILLTNGEINISPLGLIDLEELKEEEHKRRQKYGLNYNHDEIPLCVKFIPHTSDQKPAKEIIGTTQDLFQNFNDQIGKIWDQIKVFINQNWEILTSMETQLIVDSYDAKKRLLEEFSKLSADEIKKKVGLKISQDELVTYCQYLADMQEMREIVFSAAAFIKNEVVKDQSFLTVMNDNLFRNMIFWVLDNTFYEIYYYVVQKYQSYSPKLLKYLKHRQDSYIVKMRNEAYEKAKKIATAQSKFDCQKFFADIFLPIAQQLLATANDFKE